MVYDFVLFSDEVDDFKREILIESDATFMQLHDIILESVGYANDQMTSFLICDEDWERETEITQVEMDTTSDVDSFVMDTTKLDEFLNDEGQRLMFVFDYMNDRSFFMELKSIITNKKQPKPVCQISEGKAPVQVLDGLFMDDEALAKKGNEALMFGDEGDDFLEGEGFNDDELDGLSINEDMFGE